MKILFIGDIVGKPGREIVINKLPDLQKKYKIDFTIANGENLASGKGITPKIYHQMIDAGIDLITGGNHTLKREEILEIIDEDKTQILRPANWPENQPGWGFATLKKDDESLQIINLQGRTFMDETISSPFEGADKILKEYPSKFTIVDFHAEATSEKRALAEYLDGRVGAVIGTHTHVATCDEQILKKGTGFITDIGMTGPVDSILGVKKELVLNRFMVNEKEIFEVAEEGPTELDGVMIELNEKGKCASIKRLKVESLKYKE